ncbi:MAG: EAL domain-containing protein, partial [Eggerthellaceae bacterium]
MPGAFIPVLEHAGFIANLDLYVWEEACRRIRSWIDRGGRPIPVSVNISRADLYAIDVVDTIEGLVERYGIERELLELEITESAYAEDRRMSKAVNRLKDLGFTILMDDFGSGYSSLNMLKDINVDVIKIDMNFLNRQENVQRGESILEAIVSMARLMDLRIIAEGETKEQVDFLQGIGCDYAQGYYFYRPMSTEALEQLLSQDGIVDYRGVLNPSMELIDVNALLHDDMVSRAAVNNLIGGLAVYAVYADRFELLQVNNEYYHVTGCNSIDLRERQNRSRASAPRRSALVQSMFAEAYERPVTGAEATFRRYRLNGEIMWMRMRAFFLRREQDRTIFFASLADVTEQKQQEDELRESQAVLELEDEVLHRIIQQSDLNVWVYDIASDRLSFQNLSSNGIASLLAASADEEDTASLGDDVSNVLRRLSRETLWGRPAARTIKVWSNTGEPLTLHIEREIVPDANGKPARVIGYLEDPLNDSRAKLTRSDDNRLLDILKGAAVDHWYINVNTKSFLNSADRRAWRYWAGISLDDWSSSMLEDRLGKYRPKPGRRSHRELPRFRRHAAAFRRRRAQR